MSLPTIANYVDNNSTPTIASNLLKANAVLSWQTFCQKAKHLGPLLYATMPVIGDTPCHRVADAHIRKRGRDQPVILGAYIVQRTELRRVKEGRGVVNAAYLSPSASATVVRGRYGVEADCLHNYHYRKQPMPPKAKVPAVFFPSDGNCYGYRK